MRWFWKQRQEAAEEIQAHIEERADELAENGMPCEDALRQARREFGNVTLLTEASREVWGWSWTDRLGQDLRYAVRTLRRDPMFVTIVVLSLALGIGVNSALFSIVDAELFRKLTVRKPDELVMFQWQSRSWRPGSYSGYRQNKGDGENRRTLGTSFPLSVLERFRESAALAEAAGLTTPRDLVATMADQSMRVGVICVTGNYFSTLGVQTAIGRALTPEDDQPSSPPAAVISHKLWSAQYGSNIDALGKTVVLNGMAFTIVGVTPQGFQGSLLIAPLPGISGADLTVPLAFEPFVTGGRPSGDNWDLQIVARLKSASSLQRARIELEGAFAGLANDAAGNTSPPDIPKLDVQPANRGFQMANERLSDTLRNLAAVCLLLLLMVAIGLANLMLARGTARRYEIGVRLAIGASRSRLTVQLLIESFILAVVGTGLGIALSHFGREMLRVFLKTNVDLIRVDSHVFLFALLALIGTTVIFGLIPSLVVTQMRVQSVVIAHPRGQSAASSKFRNGLLVAQVSGSVVLLIGAGLFLRTLANVSHFDVGFNTNNLLLLRVDTRGLGYDVAKNAAVYNEVLDRIDSLPGVVATTAAAYPFLNSGTGYDGVAEGIPPPAETGVKWVVVRPNFLDIIGLPLHRGRGFKKEDTIVAGTGKVAVINETLARRFFGDTDPIGRRFTVLDRAYRLEIIGIVQDSSVSRVVGEVPAAIFVPSDALPTLFVRTAVDPLSLVGSIRQAIHDVDSRLAATDIKTQKEEMLETFSGTRVLSVGCIAFGGLALLLTAISLYGLIAYNVIRRTREIGIRVALGARWTNVLGLLMTTLFRLVLAGIVIGLAGANAAQGLIRSMLYGVKSSDAMTIAEVAVLVFFVTAAAGLLSARRALRIDPAIALRHDC